jgi:hypothetical protein
MYAHLYIYAAICHGRGFWAAGAARISSRACLDHIYKRKKKNKKARNLLRTRTAAVGRWVSIEQLCKTVCILMLIVSLQGAFIFFPQMIKASKHQIEWRGGAPPCYDSIRVLGIDLFFLLIMRKGWTETRHILRRSKIWPNSVLAHNQNFPN